MHIIDEVWLSNVGHAMPQAGNSLLIQGPRFNPRQSMLHFWYRKWHCDMFSSQNFCVPLSI